jgi:hypothetical protein
MTLLCLLAPVVDLDLDALTVVGIVGGAAMLEGGQRGHDVTRPPVYLADLCLETLLNRRLENEPRRPARRPDNRRVEPPGRSPTATT